MTDTAPAPTVRDQVIAEARSLPDLLAKAQTVDPALVQQLTAKSLVASKTPYGTIAFTAVAWLATHYGLACPVNIATQGATSGTIAVVQGCWTPDTINMLSGLAAVVGAGVGSAIMRCITKSPIGGFFKAA